MPSRSDDMRWQQTPGPLRPAYLLLFGRLFFGRSLGRLALGGLAGFGGLGFDRLGFEEGGGLLGGAPGGFRRFDLGALGFGDQGAALGEELGLVGRAADQGGDLDRDLRVEVDLDLVRAQALDRLVELDLAALELDALGVGG